VTDKRIRSGPEVVNAFIETVRDDATLDRSVVEAIARLHRDGKLTPTRLLQELEAARKEPTSNG
jgi:hypothetical protein